jgi:hypothetical protein
MTDFDVMVLLASALQALVHAGRVNEGDTIRTHTGKIYSISQFLDIASAHIASEVSK